MKDIILENYIKEVLYDFCKEELHEISLKDFLPKTTLEAGLQIGMVSLLAFLGVEMNKSSKLPSTPEAQAELVVDTAEDLGVLRNNDLQKTEDALKVAFKKQPLKTVYDQIPAKKLKKLRDWLSDKEGGHEVSVDGNILSRDEFKRFTSLNDKKEMQGLEPLSSKEFVELLENEKKYKQITQHLNKDEQGTITFDFEKIGLDDNQQRSIEQFEKDAEILDDLLYELEDLDEVKSSNTAYSSVNVLRQNFLNIRSYLSRIDENGDWKENHFGFTAEENANSYEKYANDEVKKIVDLYLSSN